MGCGFPVLRPGRSGLLVEAADLSGGRCGPLFRDCGDLGTALRMDHHSWPGGTVLRLGIAVGALGSNKAKASATIISDITFSVMVVGGLGWTRLV